MSLQSYGKSLCFTCLPFALDMLLEEQPGYSLVTVLSPLIDIIHGSVYYIYGPLKPLMENQVCFFFCCLYAYMYDCYMFFRLYLNKVNEEGQVQVNAHAQW